MNLGVCHHWLSEARDSLSEEKPLVFVLDPPKDDDAKKGKNAKKGTNMTNFGNALSIDKYKATERFQTAFRCRLGTML